MDDSKIAIIGLGYVGLPLSIEFGKVFKTIGFDTKKSRVADLKRGHDSSFEVTSEKFQESKQLQTSSRSIERPNQLHYF